MDRGDILSAEELRKRLYLKFKNNGIFDNLRSQLRKKLVSELDGNVINTVTKKVKTSEKTSALLLQVINWLVGDHLKIHEYNYTLSVFAAEIGTLNHAEEMFSLRDVLQLLNVNPDSEFYQNLISTKAENREKSLLFYFLQEVGLQIKQDEREMKDESIQTEMEKVSVVNTLRMKLQQVEDFYVLKKSASKMEFEENVETQLIKYKKSVEEKLRKELKDELDNFKDHEILSIKMAEREKFREELKLKVKELEKEHRIKMEEFVQKEITSRRHMNTIKEALERDIFNQRQEILSQLESARQQELDARRMAERMKIDFEMEKSKLDNTKEKIDIREKNLNDKEKSIDEMVRQMTAKERFEERQELSERMKQLSQREFEVNNKRMELETERKECQKLHFDSLDRVNRVKQLENEVKRIQELNQTLEQENKVLIANINRLEKNQILAADAETIKCQLREVMAERDEFSLKIHSLNSQLNLPSPEVLSLKRQLEAERDSRRLDRGLWDEQRRRFDAKLDAALDNNKSLSLRIDEVVAVNSQLHSVIDNLRGELRHVRMNFQENTFHGETFYDTTLDGARLPPELQLQMNSWTPPDLRLAALEKETEYLHRRIQHIRVPARNFDLTRSWERNNVYNRNGNKSASYFMPEESSMNLNSTRIDETSKLEVEMNKKYEESEAESEDLDLKDRKIRSVLFDSHLRKEKEISREISTENNNNIEEKSEESNKVMSDVSEIQIDKSELEIDDKHEIEVEHFKKNEDEKDDTGVLAVGTVNLDSLWEQKERNVVEDDVEISGADESQHDLDDW